MGVGGRSARQDAERTQPRQRSGELQSTWSATNHMRIISGGRRIRRVTTLKISPFMLGFWLVLGTACSACTMRESFPPGHEGSSSSLVAYAYFTTRVDRPLGYYLPVGYKEFNVETDENVIFVGAINYPGRAYLLRGILHRPDGTPYAEFTRSVPTSSLGGQGTFYTSHRFATADLKAFLGEWRLDLFIEDEQIGEYAFFLGDAASRRRGNRRQ